MTQPIVIDTGYSVMANGDVVTSDGLPRTLIGEHADIAVANAAKHGREVTFRKRTGAESGDCARVSNALLKSWAEFKEVQGK